MRWLLRIAGVVTLLAIVGFVAIAVTVASYGQQSDNGPADAAVVLGAAVLRTEPSPVFCKSSIDRSSPAENVSPSPVTTTTRTSSGIVSPISASASHMAGVCALRTSGRSSVTVATGPSTSKRRPTADRDSAESDLGFTPAV